MTKPYKTFGHGFQEFQAHPHVPKIRGLQELQVLLHGWELHGLDELFGRQMTIPIIVNQMEELLGGAGQRY